MSPPLLIADGPWLLYRSFFALPSSIADRAGQPVGALLGTINALLAALQARPARAVAVCMGAEQAAYRVKLYEPYHAHRPPMPAELARQWELLPGLVQSLGWTLAASETLEADDLIHSFALLETETEADRRALLVTGDRDLFQTVSERVAILEQRSRGKPVEIGPEEVRARYGVTPAQVPDFIALRGDPSDGLPGAPGIGAKTAAELLREHGSLEAVLQAAKRPSAGLRPRIAGALNEHAAQLRAFKDIATLVRVPLERPGERDTDFPAGAAAAEELGMPALAERLRGLAS
jgi:5'-3' exonuclease